MAGFDIEKIHLKIIPHKGTELKETKKTGIHPQRGLNINKDDVFTYLVNFFFI